MFRYAFSVVAALLLLGTSLNQAQAAADLGDSAPRFTLPDLQGKQHSLSDYQGKIIVLEWTNPQCPIVQRHYKLQTMKALQEKYAQQGVVWLAINSGSSAGEELNQKWAKDQGIKYPILLDKDGKIGMAYGAKTTPHMYIINAEGKLVYRGGIDDNSSGDRDKVTPYVANALEDLLSGKKVREDDTKPYGCSVKYAK